MVVQRKVKSICTPGLCKCIKINDRQQAIFFLRINQIRIKVMFL